MKMKKIYLEHLPFTLTNKGPSWIIVSIINSVEFDPSQQLKKEEVEKLCNDQDWEVHIKEKA